MHTKPIIPRPRFHRWTLWPYIACLLFDMLVILLLASCATKRAVTPAVRTVYKNATDTVLRIDSVWRHDSISVMQRGDTVWQDRWHTRTVIRYRYRVRTDTVSRTDTMAVPLRTIEQSKVTNSKAARPSGKWLSWWAGVLAGVLLSCLVKWRKPLWTMARKLLAAVGKTV